MTSSIQTWLAGVEPILQQYGLAGLFGCVFLESLGLPLPGESVLIMSGALAGAGRMNVVAAGLTAFAAAVLGDNVGFLIGRFGGRPLVVRYGGRVGITSARLARVETVVRRRGMVIVALARFVVLLRQLNGVAAGTTGMQWSRFLVANAIGAGIWVSVWLGLAFQFGSNIHLLVNFVRSYGWVVAVLVPVLLIAIAVGWWATRRRGCAPEDRVE
jgi:membrane protein DedA with SNARE-associated domain